MIKSGLVVETDTHGKSQVYPENYTLVVQAHKSVITDALGDDGDIYIHDVFLTVTNDNKKFGTGSISKIRSELYYEPRRISNGEVVLDLTAVPKLEPRSVWCVVLSPRTRVYNLMFNLDMTPIDLTEAVEVIADQLKTNPKVFIDGDRLIFRSDSVLDYTNMCTFIGQELATRYPRRV